MLFSVIAISAGAALGATARWLLGLALNAAYPLIPLGTLAANLLGGFICGLALSVFVAFPIASPTWRLFIVTGFLGALTTFSTFSAEVASLLQQQRFFIAGAAAALHVGGSLAAFFLGMGTFVAVRRFFQ